MRVGLTSRGQNRTRSFARVFSAASRQSARRSSAPAAPTRRGPRWAPAPRAPCSRRARPR
eukprot:4772840-Prymnesium_polylepis.1